MRTDGRRLLLFVVASLLLANVGQPVLCHVFKLPYMGGMRQEMDSFVHVRQWTDSWLPMMRSLDYFHAHPEQPIYAAKLYDTLIYSLASLLPLEVMRRVGMSDATMLRALAWGSWLAVWGTAAAVLAMAWRLLQRRGVRMDAWSAAAVVLATVGCYPLLKGYALGNAQTFLSFEFALLLWFWVSGWEIAAGVVAALLMLVKPQFALLAVWFALRRRWGALAATLVCAAVLLGVSVAVFGLRNNLDYVGVLASLSHKAQSHYANQSMFGTLNRMAFHGENLPYHPFVYTPYVAWIYRTTVATSLALVAAALFFPWGKMRGSAGDLGAMGVISVAASPMAWEHHYGIVLGVFAWVWFSYASGQRRQPWLLGLSFFLCANFLSMTNLLWDRPGWNVLQSYLYFGALLLVGVLMTMAVRLRRGEEPVV